MRHLYESTNVNMQTGNVLRTQSTTEIVPPSILPRRFNSTSEPCELPIIRPELSSTSEPKRS
jgi:hypothetical protein